MTREEFEERLRALEAQHQEDIALMNAAHEARVRSLRSLWGAATDPPPAPKPASKRKRERRSVLDDLAEVFEVLPEVFDKRDVARALGYEPSHTTLVRALHALMSHGVLGSETLSSGGTRSRYRKLHPEE
jgi:hypothetical protein